MLFIYKYIYSVIDNFMVSHIMLMSARCRIDAKCKICNAGSLKSAFSKNRIVHGSHSHFQLIFSYLAEKQKKRK